MSEVVALTGATGFIGRALLSSLVNRNISVRALCRNCQQDTKSVTWIKGELSSASSLNELLENASYVIHCAGVVRGKSLSDFVEVNTTGTQNLIAAVKRQNKNTKILLMSSLAAREPDLSWYATSKHQAEELLRVGNDISWTIFRPTAVYGPGDKEIRPLLQLVRKGLLPAPAVNTSFSLLHINDLVHAVESWLEKSDVHGKTYELDDGTASGYNWQTLIELADQVWGKSVIRLPVPITVLNILATANLVAAKLLHYSPMLTPGKVCEIIHPDWSCDITEISQDLDWHPGIRLLDAMRDTSLLGL